MENKARLKIRVLRVFNSKSIIQIQEVETVLKILKST